jgi:hypothetical protein
MNCRMASSVCGDVGFAAIEVEEARELLPPPRVEAVMEEVIEVEDEEGSWGGWCRRRKRAPEGVRNAEMCAAVGG